MKLSTYETPISYEVICRMRAANANGFLVVEKLGKTNLECHLCGKHEVMEYTAVVIHPTRQSRMDDPMQGEAYTFGSSCWKKFKKEIGI